MQKYIKKTKIIGRIFLSVAIIAAIAFFVGIFTFSLMPDFVVPLIFLSFFMSVTFFITYFVKFFWIGHTFKFLKKSGFEHYIDDIDLTTTPTFEKAKIYCGENAFFCKRTGSVVAYDQFAWIYNSGGQLGEYTIRLKSGKKAYVMIRDSCELHSLLNNYVAPKSSKIIEGKTVQAKKEFLRLYPETVLSLDKGKTIGGAILSTFALVSITFGLINGTLNIYNLIVEGILEVAGLSLLLYGLKGSSLVSLASSIQDRLAQSAFFNILCKGGSVFAMVCMVLFFIVVALEIEQLFISTLIGYGIGMVFLIGSLFLRTGFFAKETPTFIIQLPNEMLDDTSFITDVSFVQEGDLFIYAFRLTNGYGWDYIRDSVDHLFSADFGKEDFTLSVGDFNAHDDITKVYLKGKKTGEIPLEWAREQNWAKVFGKSKALKSFVGVVFYNQTSIIQVSFSLKNEKIATAYVETLIRRNFGTPDQLKLANPFSLKEPVSISDGHSVHVDTVAFARYIKHHPECPRYEFCGTIPLIEKEPILCLYEDGVKTREYCLQTEGEEDFTGKYFLISIRLENHGYPAVPVAQIDGFISDTPDDRKMTLNDIGYRMEGHFLACGGVVGKHRYEMTRGQDLPIKALKYQGYTTPSNIRLVGICPECEKSFCFHGYAFYMRQSDVAYSDDGLDCCEIQAYEIDKESWTYETEGKVFRYYNSFNCPHCGTPYIDYKNHPENKVFGVSGCVHLGRKYYQYK